MRAYKFLDAEQRAPFTATPWRVGEWVEAAAASPCHAGVHGCLAADVSWWLAATMWELELDGDIVTTRHKVAGRRGRLVGPVTAYDTAVRELGAVGAWRARDRAIVALRAGAEHELADRLAQVDSLDDLAALGGDVDESWPGMSAGLAADSAHFALHGDNAQSPFVAACSAGHERAGPDGDQAAFDAGFAAERAFQSAWLTDRLSLG